MDPYEKHLADAKTLGLVIPDRRPPDDLAAARLQRSALEYRFLLDLSDRMAASMGLPPELHPYQVPPINVDPKKE